MCVSVFVTLSFAITVTTVFAMRKRQRRLAEFRALLPIIITELKVRPLSLPQR